jgi:hypothetical protein
MPELNVDKQVLQAMDVAIVDAVWNGVWQSMKIAAAADGP